MIKADTGLKLNSSTLKCMRDYKVKFMFMFKFFFLQEEKKKGENNIFIYNK